MRLILIRHAETANNRDSLVQGQADIPLSPLGEQQAAALGDWLRQTPLHAVIASPLRRALTTAEAVAAGRGLAVETDPALMEMHVGAMEGLSSAAMRATHPEFLRAWGTESGSTLEMPGGGESLTQVQARAWRVVERLHHAYPDETVALVSHNFVLGCMLTRALELPLTAFRRFRFSVSGASTLHFRADRTVLVRFNDTCHLDRAGLPTTDPWLTRAPSRPRPQD